MLIGNLIGLTQRNLKRLLAYSSIAHAGYALLGLLAWESGGSGALLFYLVAYAFMNLGAFAVVSSLERRGEGLMSHELKGLARRRPLVAAAMAWFLLSLAGVPPTAGFVGKLYLFLALIEAGWIKLAVLAVAYSALAAYYYLRVIVVMYMEPEVAADPDLGLPAPEPLSPVRPAGALVLALAAAGVLALGIWPSRLMEILSAAAAALR
jgi:NADH-quinone oxidoreductase subunit N